MKLTSLRNALSARTANEVLVEGSDTHWTAADLLSGQQHLENIVASGRARAVLMLNHPGHLLQAMAAYENSCDKFLLLSPDVLPKEIDDLLARFAPDAVFREKFGPYSGPERDNTTDHRPASPTERHGPCSILFATSGTTGTPKLVEHSFASLAASVKPRGANQPALKWGLFYSPLRFAGMQVLLHAIVGGGSLVISDQDASLSNQIATLARLQCNALSATPSMWRKLLMMREATKLKLQQITLGGEIADAAVLANLAKTFPEARIVHIYASTEAGVGFAVKDGLSGFPASYLDVGPEGIRLRIEAGRLHIQSKNASVGYFGSSTPIRDQNGFVDTGDCVEEQRGRIYFRGRENGSLNVGGNKVLPEEVEAVLLSFPGVAEARVKGKPSPILGTILVAEVRFSHQPKEIHSDLIKELRRYCATRLPNWQLPAIIKIADRIELSTAGKLKRQST